MSSIYVSSTNIRNSKIGHSVQRLAELGFKNIELSGGAAPYKGMIEDLLNLRDKYGLIYRCHNYFPPPQIPFVLNLAASDDAIVDLSQNLIRSAIDLSVRLGAKFYGVHAGFRAAPQVSELGSKLEYQPLDDHESTVERFIEQLTKAKEYAFNQGIELFVENNVCTPDNISTFSGDNPFLLTCWDEFEELRARINIDLLLDIAHLKVSCQSLGLDFKFEFDRLIKVSNYLHLSDNDGTKDANEGLRNGTELYDLLQNANLKEKTFTLEIYDGEKSMIRSYEIMEDLLG